MSGQNMDYSDVRINALESERDALVRAQQGFIELRDHDRAEINRLKADLAKDSYVLNNLKEDRDLWKSKVEHWKHEADRRSQKAEKLAEALRKITNESSGWNTDTVLAKEALAEFEKETIGGIRIKIDPTLKPGEWRLEK